MCLFSITVLEGTTEISGTESSIETPWDFLKRQSRWIFHRKVLAVVPQFVIATVSW